MGLGMYLEKDIYIGANYEHNKVTGTIALQQGGKPIQIDLSRLVTVTERVGQWRKANQIHKWFVDNVQDGDDDCKRYYVSWELLLKLKAECQVAIDAKDATSLPPQSGFFFGSTEVDDYYWENLRETISIIDRLDPDGEYYYDSSW